MAQRRRGKDSDTTRPPAHPITGRCRCASSPRAPASDRPLLVIDGDSFAHRAYHGVPKTVRRAGNKGGGAIVGFANYLLRLYEAERPRAVLVGWDTLDVPNWRQRIFASYQGGRVFDAELLDQLAVLPQLVAACGFANAKQAGYEADDFLAAAVAAEEARGGTAIVASGDRDSYQLASEHTTIVAPVKAGVMARIGPAEVKEKYGVEPRQVPDFIALRGDPSDKIPGAKGVGPWTAASLLGRYADARGCARRRTVRGTGRGPAALSPHRDDGCERAAAAAPGSGSRLAGRREAGARLGTQGPGRALRRLWHARQRGLRVARQAGRAGLPFCPGLCPWAGAC